MGSVRRSATSRLEEGEATWLAWTSATDSRRASLAETEYSIRSPQLDGIGISDAAEIGTPTPQHEHNSQSPEPILSQETSIDRTIANGDIRSQTLPACRSIFLDGERDNGADEFEPVGDLPSLPKLDFKPIILREGTLIAIAVFYLGLLTGLGVLYYYKNEARIFHISSTASRFSIRIAPSLIGSLSTLVFQSVVVNFSRILPYIIMASPTNPRDQCAIAKKTLMANYFPFMNAFNAYANRHVPLLVMIVIHVYLNPFITPAKSTLIHKRVSEQDPDSWTISISAAAAQYLIFNYSILFLIILGLLVYLWNRRTGLKWDPVSLADNLMLLQGSDILDDFSGLEYWRSKSAWVRFFQGERSQERFHDLQQKQYRLGYWRHLQTNQYWHGIRQWPASRQASYVQVPSGRPFNPAPTPNLQHTAQAAVNALDTSTREPIADAASSVFERDGDEFTKLPILTTHEDPPRITDRSPKAMSWWKSQCAEVLDQPGRCYRVVYGWVSDWVAALIYVIVFGLVTAGVWTLATGRLETGFVISTADYAFADFILVFLPTFLVGLLNGYWYQIDIWYRQLQVYMGLRRPSPASENLLLSYPCDLPVVVTLKALQAGHWRLALTSIMPLVQRALPILAGSLFTVENVNANKHFEIGISATPFKTALGMLCAYLILILIVWPGLDRRLPIAPGCIADSIVMFYDSTLVNKDAFLPRKMDEQRWHMKYRLCLEDRLYGFGIYTGRYGALHLGLDEISAAGNSEAPLRCVVLLKPPRRYYRRWLEYAVVVIAEKLGISRLQNLGEEEAASQKLLRAKVQELGESRTSNLHN